MDGDESSRLVEFRQLKKEIRGSKDHLGIDRVPSFGNDDASSTV
jgi:hypothetical protein